MVVYSAAVRSVAFYVIYTTTVVCADVAGAPRVAKGWAERDATPLSPTLSPPAVVAKVAANTFNATAVALGALSPPAVPAKVATPNATQVYYQHFPGYISDGGDLRVAMQTVEVAKSFCTSLPDCVGFTFNGVNPSPEGLVEIRFKSITSRVLAAGWQTYIQSDTPPTPPAPPPGYVDVTTSLGPIVGYSSYEYDAQVMYDRFLGVPFAEAPLGSKRFQPPEEPEPWTYPKYCTYTAPACAQTKGEDGFAFGSEDCLYLNVWRPAVKKNNGSASAGGNSNSSASGGNNAAEGLPVMVWLHGGGFIYGDAGNHNGAYIAAKHNMIVVNIQYRLDVFGFLSLEALQNEQPDKTSGNYGIQDQRLGLEWVQKNIAAFGGDPSRVTLAGQSAGGVSVCLHLTSPASKGLFAQALLMSPLCESALLTFPEPQATAFGLAYAHHLGCKGADGPDLVRCLRGLTTAELTPELRLPKDDFKSTRPLPRLIPFLPWGPVVDGSERGVQHRPIEQVKRGVFSNVPILVGTVRDEGSFFVPVAPFLAGVLYPLSRIGLDKLIDHFWPTKIAKEVEDLYPNTFGESANECGNRLVTDGHFACSIRALLREIEQQNDLAMRSESSNETATKRGDGEGVETNSNNVNVNVNGNSINTGSTGRGTNGTVSTIAGRRSLIKGRKGRNGGAGSGAAAASASAAARPFRGLYQFKFLSKNPLTPLFGAFHTAELAYLFHDKKEWWSEEDEVLSLQMECLISAFVRSGTPNDRKQDYFAGCGKVLGSIVWPEYTARGDANLVFDSPLGTNVGLKAAVCDGWDAIGYSNTIQ